MPRRVQKRTDTEKSDSFEEDQPKDKIIHFGTVRFNPTLAPDQIQGDDTSKYSILAWSNTLYAQRFLPWTQRKQLFTRALSFLPYSYKIWFAYLTEFIQYCQNRALMSKEYKELNQTFQKALEFLPKMPRIWIMYAESLSKQFMISKARNLPMTQHEKIWKKYTSWVLNLNNENTAMKVIPRYLKVNPDFKQNFADYLKKRQLYNQCLEVLQQILDDSRYSSKKGFSRKQFFLEMVEIIAEYPDKATIFNGETKIREAMSQYPEEAGKLWIKLSDYFIRLGQFDQARSILEEALNTIDNVKDFGIIFNAYSKFEQEMITALANDQIRKDYQVIEKDNVDYEIEKRLEKLQKLIERQPYLLHKINIKKNVNNVSSWMGLFNLYKAEGNYKVAKQIIEEAIEKITPEQAEGKYSQIWIQFCNLIQNEKSSKVLIELTKRIQECNFIMHKASQVNFKLTQDYNNIWLHWIEMLLVQSYYEDALKIVDHILFRRKKTPSPENQLSIKNIEELMKSNPTFWQLYIDIELNIGNFQTIKKAYERCKQHRCLTPIMLLNFTNFLWQHAYFEETFRVFEFAVGNFKWPSLYEVWISYVKKFTSRYGSTGIGLERARSMFERLLKDIPKEHAEIFYFMYAEFQEENGLYSQAIEIYDRMVTVVPKERKFEAYSIYICKVSKMLGITKTRAIFEAALQKLSQKEIIKIGKTYAELQTNLGEIDRARGVFSYIGQFSDPKDDREELWDLWQKFQIEFGDKESYKQYLRIRRSVEAKYHMLPPDLDKIEADVRKSLI